MGMFDKDKQFGNRLDTMFPLGTPFALFGAELTGETITTKLGESEVAAVRVARLDGSATNAIPPVLEARTIASAIVDKVRDAEPDDFPALVELRRVPSSYGTSALVLQFLAPYTGADPATGEVPA